MKIFYLPDLGEGLAEAEIREWYVKEGDEVKVDQPLVSMETAKALVDVPSPFTGKIAILHGKSNDIIQTGAPLISFESDEITSPTSQMDKGSVVGALQESAQSWQEESISVDRKNKQASVKAMPAARLLATQMQIDLQTITPTGPSGLITIEDVKKAMTSHTATAASSVTSPLTNGEGLHGLRRSMAHAMTQAHKEVVATTVIEDADLTQLAANTDLSVHMLRAIAAAVKVEPALNAWFDGKAVARQLFSEVHIGLAVDTNEGLLVPVIHDVDKQSSAALRQCIDNYKQGAKTRSIAQADFHGATITLSNFGTITGRYATPIVIPPTVAILACGRSRDSVVVRDGKMLIARLMPLSLTFDHRAVTGGEATRFLAAVIDYLQKPA